MAISSGYTLNIEKFEEFCKETARLYVERYWWYPMTSTVHKVLIHGPAIATEFILPIGLLSEEALEASNKNIRKYRERFTRKFSREKTNEDIFLGLLLNSCPKLSSSRQKKRIRDIPKRVQDMLILTDKQKKIHFLLIL